MSRWDSVSITAHYTAQIWVRNGLPWAFRFDTLRGRALYEATQPLFDLAATRGVSTPPVFCLQRHLIIDALLTQLAPPQVIELACGLSPRCLAYSHRHQIPCVDVDLPRMIQHKLRRVGDAAPDSYRARALDLTASEDYAADLGGAVQRAPGTVVITEGVLSYFDAELQQEVFNRVAALLRWCGGGTYLTDVHHGEAVEALGAPAAAFRWALHTLSGTRQISLIRDFETGARMMSRAGLADVRCHQPAQYAHLFELPDQVLGSGMTVYQARVPADAQEG